MDDDNENENDQQKLNQAIVRLERLKKHLNAYNQNCTKAVQQLEHFDDRLEQLETAIISPYLKMAYLVIQKLDHNKALAQLDYVLPFYATSDQVAAIIHVGPKDTSLEVYLDALDRLREAMHYFERNNPRCQESLKVRSLWSKGGQQMEKEFRALVLKYSSPLSIGTIFELVEAKEEIEFDDEHGQEDEEEAQQETVSTAAFEKQMPAKIRHQLKLLSDWLSVHRNDDFFTFYSSIRSNVLHRSLNTLRQHFRSSGLKEVVNLDSIISHQNMLNRGNLTTKKRSKKSSQKYRLDYTISEREIASYLTLTMALYKLMQLEFKLLRAIMPSSPVQRALFSRLVVKAVDSLYREGEWLCWRATFCLNRHPQQDFFSALALLPLLRYHLPMRYHFDNLFAGCQPGVASKLHSLVVTLQTTLTKAVEAFLLHIKSCHLHGAAAPKDGTVHELTSNVMRFLAQMNAYQDILWRVLIVSDVKAMMSCSDKGRYAFAQYIYRALTSLEITLGRTSQAYSHDKTLQTIFKLNNDYYILKMLQKCNLFDILKLYSLAEKTEEKYEITIRDHKRCYFECWNKVLPYLNEAASCPLGLKNASRTDPTSRSPLNSADRQKIKEKFTSLNRELVLLYNAQKDYAISDQQLKEALTEVNLDLIVPRYAVIYEKYIGLEFTKKPHKYIRFTPDEVAQMINTFFESA